MLKHLISFWHFKMQNFAPDFPRKKVSSYPQKLNGREEWVGLVLTKEREIKLARIYLTVRNTKKN